MTKLKQNVTSSIKIKSNKNVSSPIANNKDISLTEVERSILRGNLLRYSQYIDAVKNNIKDLKNSNPKYLKLIADIIELSIANNSVIDIDIPLEILLAKFSSLSFNNQEALDFTKEVLFYADEITSKYYLSVISGQIIDDLELKQHFRATIPFLKYIFASIQTLSGIEKAERFIEILSIIINKNVDYKKIELLPKIKYIVDSSSKNEYDIDITTVLHSKIAVDELQENINTLSRDIKSAELHDEYFDCANYLIKN